MVLALSLLPLLLPPLVAMCNPRLLAAARSCRHAGYQAAGDQEVTGTQHGALVLFAFLS